MPVVKPEEPEIAGYKEKRKGGERVELDIEGLDIEIMEFSEEELEELSAPAPETPQKYKQKTKIFLESLEIRTESFREGIYQLISNTQEQLKLPLPGEMLRIRTQQSINLIGIILKIISTHDQIDNLTIATYTLNKEASSAIFDLVKTGRIRHLNLLIASSYTFRNKDVYTRLKEDCQTLSTDGYDVHLTFAWSHFKITLAKCGENYYQFEGSMNYSQNNMAEQLSFENNKTTYDYDYVFITEIIHRSGHAALDVVC